jgi:hypothetical protein
VLQHVYYSKLSETRCFISSALEYATVKLKMNQRELKLNLPHQLSAFAADDNLLEEIVYVIKEKTEALFHSSVEVTLSENAEIDTLMSHHGTARQNHNINYCTQPLKRSLSRFESKSNEHPILVS